MSKITKLHETADDRFRKSVEDMLDVSEHVPAMIIYGDPESNIESLVFAGNTQSVATLNLMIDKLKAHLIAHGYNYTPEE